MLSIETLQQEAIGLLKVLIKTPSFSGQEDGTAGIISAFLTKLNIKFERFDNNIVAKNLHFEESKPTVLLNSHHDTVKVVNNWTKEPHGAAEENGIIYGLGSNDAGASLVSLIACFVHYYYSQNLAFNIILAATAEEENFGPKGVKSILDTVLKDVTMGIVGEPTEMQMAIAEKGLIVIDAEVHGVAGHAARSEGENAIYKAIKDIEIIRNFRFENESAVLGPNVINVTQVNAGHQHNVVPDLCKFVIDLRVNECYTLQEAFDLIDEQTVATLTARSFNNNPSGIDLNHPIIKKGIAQGLGIFGSATLSDQAHMKFPTVKMGPGKSERSHTPDEYIYIKEIKEGIEIYIQLLNDLKI